MRDTTTGAQYEERVNLSNRHPSAIDVSKYKLYQYMKTNGVIWTDVLSSKLLPDEAYLDDGVLYVYEKKYQQVDGSADEKLQTCGFKIAQFKKIATLIGANDAFYTYILSDWFKQPKYRDVLAYIDTIPNCNYEFDRKD